MLIGYFNRLVGSFSDIDCLRLGGALLSGECAPNYTGKVAATLGYWQYIGYRPELLQEYEIPELQMAFTVYLGDEVVRTRVPINSANRTLLFKGLGAVVIELKQHFRLP